MALCKKIGLFLLLFMLLLAFQQGVSLLGGRAANALGLMPDDPAKPYQWVSAHHIVQLALGLLAILAVWLTRRTDFMLRPKMDKRGNLYLTIFTGLVLALTVLGFRLMYPSSDDIYYNYALTAPNIAGVLGFQLLLSGPSEEIVFRALPITLFLSVCKSPKTRAAQWISILAASVLFSLGHVSWYVNPFRLSFSWFQLGYCFLYGVAYGIAYLQTRSVVYPMLMHSVSNLIMVGMGYVFKLALPWG